MSIPSATPFIKDVAPVDQDFPAAAPAPAHGTTNNEDGLLFTCRRDKQHVAAGLLQLLQQNGMQAWELKGSALELEYEVKFDPNNQQDCANLRKLCSQILSTEYVEKYQGDLAKLFIQAVDRYAMKAMEAREREIITSAPREGIEEIKEVLGIMSSILQIHCVEIEGKIDASLTGDHEYRNIDHEKKSRVIRAIQSLVQKTIDDELPIEELKRGFTNLMFKISPPRSIIGIIDARYESSSVHDLKRCHALLQHVSMPKGDPQLTESRCQPHNNEDGLLFTCRRDKQHVAAGLLQLLQQNGMQVWELKGSALELEYEVKFDPNNQQDCANLRKLCNQILSTEYVEKYQGDLAKLFVQAVDRYYMEAREREIITSAPRERIAEIKEVLIIMRSILQIYCAKKEGRIDASLTGGDREYLNIGHEKKSRVIRAIQSLVQKTIDDKLPIEELKRKFTNLLSEIHFSKFNLWAVDNLESVITRCYALLQHVSMPKGDHQLTESRRQPQPSMQNNH